MQRAVFVVLLGLLGLTGCATGTRMAQYGPLTGDHMFVTLVVSEDPDVIARECAEVRAAGRVLGCQTSAPVALPNGLRVRTMKVVRYTDSLPSPLAFEIDIHELCHAVAALQILDDPCHKGNDGVAQTSTEGHAMIAR